MAAIHPIFEVDRYAGGNVPEQVNLAEIILASVEKLEEHVQELNTRLEHQNELLQRLIGILGQ